MLQIPGLYIAHTDKKGRGVFTSTLISEGDTIEVCPVIFIPKDQIEFLNQTSLYDYYFLWPDDKRVCIALGFGSLYNHDSNPNAEVVFDLESEQIVIKCIQKIDAGEEICIHYLGDDSKEKPYWFGSYEL